MDKGPEVKINWVEFRQYESSINKMEETFLKKFFRQIIDGNSNLKDLSQPELDTMYDMFRTGWISHAIL